MNYQSSEQSPRRKRLTYRLTIEGLEERHLMAAFIGEELSLDSPLQSISLSILETSSDLTAEVKTETGTSEPTESEDNGSHEMDVDGKPSLDDERLDEQVSGDPLDVSRVSESGPTFNGSETLVDPGLTTTETQSGESDVGTLSGSLRTGVATTGTLAGQTTEHRNAGQAFSGLRPYVSPNVSSLSTTPSGSLDDQSFHYFAADNLRADDLRADNLGDDDLGAASNSPHLLRAPSALDTYFALSLLTHESVVDARTKSAARSQRTDGLRHSISQPADATPIVDLAGSRVLTVSPPSSHKSSQSLDAGKLASQPTASLQQSVKLVGLAVGDSCVIECGSEADLALNPPVQQTALSPSQFTFDFMGVCRIESLVFLVTFLTPLRDTFKKSSGFYCDDLHDRRP